MRSLHARDPHPSGEFTIDRLDWLKAAIIGVTDRELAILRSVADIDGHTASYMRQVLRTQVPAHSASNTFLTLWNKEEFQNCQDMARLFACCGIDLKEERANNRQKQDRISRWMRRGVRYALARWAPRTAMALHLSWAAAQKFMLTKVYQQLADTTTNPVLRALCLRIVKQEQRNYHWYFSGARTLLSQAEGSRRVVRLLLRRAWYPLSSKAKSKDKAFALLNLLFPGKALTETMSHLDAVMAQLPGFGTSDFTACFGSESPSAGGLQAQRA